MVTNRVADFHRKRVAFAVLDGKLIIRRDDPRSHAEFLKEDFGVPASEFETVIRGYILGYRVQFFMGSDFHAVPDDAEFRDAIALVRQELTTACYYSDGAYTVYNGVVPGEPGEVWGPLDLVTTIMVE